MPLQKTAEVADQGAVRPPALWVALRCQGDEASGRLARSLTLRYERNEVTNVVTDERAAGVERPREQIGIAQAYEGRVLLDRDDVVAVPSERLRDGGIDLFIENEPHVAVQISDPLTRGTGA